MIEIQTRFGHRYHTGDLQGDVVDAALSEVLAMPFEAFDRYDSPFERKWTLREKHIGVPANVGALIGALEYQAPTVAAAFGFDRLNIDSMRHYCGVFRYDPGDHLGVHVDAGIHPETIQRKQVTALLYLGGGGGDLELWAGDNAAEGDPQVYSLVDSIMPVHGRVVIFENNDRAWHGVAQGPRATIGRNRVVITVSYLNPVPTGQLNMRERAFFVPRPDERWDDATWKLRDLRADPHRHAEAYVGMGEVTAR